MNRGNGDGMKEKVTRNDVARLAGVSPAVVSYVMNNSNYVSEEKREAVLNAVKALDYTPNMFAKGLRTNRSNMIALIGDTLQAELFGELSTRIFEQGYFPTLFFSQPDDAFVKRIIDSQFAAVFMTSNRFTEEQLNRIVDSGISLVLYESRAYSGLDSKIVIQVPDIYDGVKKIMSYLILKDHKRIAMIPPLKYRTAGINGNDYRARAYSDTLKFYGLEPQEKYFCVHTQTINSIMDDIFKMLTLPEKERPTAFTVGDDYLAALVMRGIKQLGLRVPEDVAVVGWGNIPSATITTPELTTIDYPIAEFAEKVVDTLMQLLYGGQPESRRYPGELIIRGST